MRKLTGLLAKIAGVFFAIGFVALAAATISELVGAPPENGYPALSGPGAAFGTYAREIGLWTVISGTVGFVAFWFSDLA